MAKPTTNPPDATPPASRNLFAELRRHNAQRARVARLLAARDRRRVEHVLFIQRRHRIHKAR